MVVSLVSVSVLSKICGIVVIESFIFQSFWSSCTTQPHMKVGQFNNAVNFKGDLTSLPSYLLSPQLYKSAVVSA